MKSIYKKLSVIFACLLVFEIIFIIMIKFNGSNALIFEQSYSNVDSININVKNCDVIIKRSEDNRFHFNIYGNSKRKGYYKFSDVDDAININTVDSIRYKFGNKRGTIEIYLPIMIDKKLFITTDVGHISSSINVMGAFNSDSGNINIFRIDDSSQVFSNSGDINIEFIDKVKGGIIKSISGDINILNVGKIGCNISSDASIKGKCIGKERIIDIISSSGNINIG